MKRIPLLILALMSVIALAAQTTITGTVRDGGNREILDFASVALYNAGDTKPLDGTTTDSEGFFVVSVKKDGTYSIEISMMGYETVVKTITAKGKKTIDLGTIYLNESAEALQEVEVVAQGSQMRFELDKKVFTVDQAIAAAGGSITDALENIPSVDVDQEGNISLRNSEDVEIWINGKPAGLTAENRAQVLQQMPAGSIKEIEIITNPSAKYSSEGTAGIINLVTTKDRQGGYYGSLTGRIDYALAKPWTQLPGGNLGLNLNFSKSIVDGYFNAGWNYHSSNGRSYNDRYSFMAADTTRLIKDGTSNHRSGSMFLRAGLDLHVTDRSIIGISGFGMVSVPNDKSGGFFSSNSNNPVHYDQYDVTHYEGPQSGNNTESLVRSYDRNSYGSGSHPGGNVMLDWRFTITPQHYFKASAQFSEFHWNQDQFYEQKENDLSSTQEQLNENRDRNIQLKADYEWKPTQSSRLEAGWQTDIAWRQTLAEAWDGANRNTFLTNYYNDFRNDEQTHAFYVTYGNRFWERFSIQVGLRGEYFRRHLESSYYNGTEVTTATQDTSYFQLFPTVYLNYSFDEGHEIQANYTRRINRPRGHQINPRQDFSDSTNIQYGNPNLLPSYSSSVEINYLKYWERHTISAGLFYRFRDQVTQNIKYMDGSLMRNTFVNLGTRHEAGIEFVAKNKFFGEFLDLTTSLDFYYNRMDRATYTPVLNGVEYPEIVVPEQNIFAFGARLNIGFMFTKTFTGQISARYRSPRVVAQGTSSHSYSIDLSLRKTFLDRTLALAFNCKDILNSRSRSNTTSSDTFWQFSENQWHSRELNLSLTWNFGNMKRKHDKNQQNSAMSESAITNNWSGEGADE